MVGRLLVRGMIVGLLAALLAFGFAKVYGEPSVEKAIAFETAMDSAKVAAKVAATSAAKDGAGTADAAAMPPTGSHAASEPELFSRATQSGLGLFTGLMVYGTAFGGLFALVFAFAWGRMGRLGPRGTAAMLALLTFIAVILVPGLKYPPNPPSVGEADTIMLRTQLYFAMLVLSALGMVLAVWVANRLRAQFGVWTATILAGAALVAGLAVVTWALPGIDEVPEGFPASLLWQFRIAAWGIQAVLWAGIGLGFGIAAEQVLMRRTGALDRGYRPI